MANTRKEKATGVTESAQRERGSASPGTTNRDVVFGEIEGLKVVPLLAHVDDRGYLIEILRATDDHFFKFGQVYLSGDVRAGTVRGFHKHEKIRDCFFITHGHAKLVFADDRPDSCGHLQIVVTGDRNPCLVVVPPGIFHGWVALADDTQLLVIASEVYDRKNPDEVRIPADSFGDVWSIKGR